MVCAWADQPTFSNHWLFLALTQLSVLVVVAPAVLSRSATLLEPSRFFRAVAPVLRIEAMALYLFAALAKLSDSERPILKLRTGVAASG